MKESILNLAKRIKNDSQRLYNHFKGEGNEARMLHMNLIFDCAERVRYELETDSNTKAPRPPWNVFHAISQIGYSDDSDTEEINSLYSNLSELEKSFKLFTRVNNNY